MMSDSEKSRKDLFKLDFIKYILNLENGNKTENWFGKLFSV